MMDGCGSMRIEMTMDILSPKIDFKHYRKKDIGVDNFFDTRFAYLEMDELDGRMDIGRIWGMAFLYSNR